MISIYLQTLRELYADLWSSVCAALSSVFCCINLAVLDFLTSKLYLLISGRFPSSLWVPLPRLKPENSPGSKPEQILALTSFVSLLSGITVILHFPSSIVLKTMDIKYISYIFIFHTFCLFFLSCLKWEGKFSYYFIMARSKIADLFF